MEYQIKKLPISIDNETIQLNYTSWGNPEAEEKIICVHGLTRNCRDFDYIAKALAEDYHVICPDMPGRGESSWFNDYRLYNHQTYVNCLYQLIDHYKIKQASWIGSSMGGLLGMTIAVERTFLLNKFILNDIGPYVPYKALSKIGTYVNIYPLFKDLAEAEQYLRKIIPNFGIKNEEDWKYITQNSFTKLDNNFYQQAYDPKLVQAFIETTNQDINIWDIWNQIKAEILVLRGEKSNILLKETADLMKKTKSITLYELQDVGHTPSLMNKKEIDLVKNWLSNT